VRGTKLRWGLEIEKRDGELGAEDRAKGRRSPTWLGPTCEKKEPRALKPPRCSLQEFKLYTADYYPSNGLCARSEPHKASLFKFVAFFASFTSSVFIGVTPARFWQQPRLAVLLSSASYLDL